MTVSSVKRLSDDALRRDLRDLVAHDRITNVRLLIHIAEFQARRLYLQDGYSSMHEYCVGELGMSADVAYKRVRAARKARKYPRILTALAESRLTLSAVALLAPHLNDRTAEELLTEAEHKSNKQVADLIARSFPKPDLPTLVQPVFASQELAARPILDNFEVPVEDASRPVTQTVEPAWRPTVKPLAPTRYSVQFTMGHEDRELLQRAKDLLSHQIPSGDEGQVFVHALRELVRQIEKRKYGATEKPRNSSRESDNPRHNPARVRRAVRERDGDRCTFVAASGRRCEARKYLEFDHIEPVARGGRSTVDNLRLLCRAHNQHSAEHTYGAAFMEAKREEAAAVAAAKRIEEVIPWLRALGCRPNEARSAVERSGAGPDASLEERVRLAVSQLGPRGVTRSVSGSASMALS